MPQQNYTLYTIVRHQVLSSSSYHCIRLHATPTSQPTTPSLPKIAREHHVLHDVHVTILLDE